MVGWEVYFQMDWFLQCEQNFISSGVHLRWMERVGQKLPTGPSWVMVYKMKCKIWQMIYHLKLLSNKNEFCYVSIFLPSLKMQNYCLMWRPIGISRDCLLFKVILQEVFLIFFNVCVSKAARIPLSLFSANRDLGNGPQRKKNSALKGQDCT